MYDDFYSDEIIRKLSILRKKDPAHYSAVIKKMHNIISSPNHSYKSLRYHMKGIKRVHMGHFVLIFIIDHARKRVSFEDYDHHDNIYR
jgi:mRNA-degrading endonuclease RelE of RelBE toxin-antitoxin system